MMNLHKDSDLMPPKLLAYSDCRAVYCIHYQTSLTSVGLKYSKIIFLRCFV